MKNLLTLIILWQAVLGLGAAETNSQISAPTIIERGAHRRVWQRDDFITLNDGRVINRPHRTVELASTTSR